MAALVDTASSPETLFDEWVTQLAEEVKGKGFAVRDGVSSFSGVNTAQCRLEAEGLRNLMKPSTISTGLKNESVETKRSDHVTFLKKNDELSNSSPNLFLHTQWIDNLRASLDIKLNLKMESSTFMLAEYPSGGTKYIKHRDAAPSEYAGRKLTALYYLNPVWDQDKDGGELHLWPEDKELPENDMTPLVFEPTIDRLIIFKSFLEHEVQPSFFHRIALTTWFVNRRHQALELMCEHLSLKQDDEEAQQEE